MKQVSLECGGKTPQVFMADIEDLDRAVTAAYRGIYSNMGEVCNAGSRLLVDRSIRKKFVERFIELGEDAFKPGDPLDPDQHGPARHARRPEARARHDRQGPQGRREARVRRRRLRPEEGAYVNPTLFTASRTA
jgi:gamma-glutamyl-gamma-aminobutyraldehyde dehydrogenase